MRAKEKDLEGFLVSHCPTFKDCSPDLVNTSVIKKSKTRVTWEIAESERISRLGEGFVSMAFITLSDKELAYLRMRR